MVTVVDPVEFDAVRLIIAYPFAGAVYTVAFVEVLAATAPFTLIVVFELTSVALIDSP
jgi:hypothetical protein